MNIFKKVQLSNVLFVVGALNQVLAGPRIPIEEDLDPYDMIDPYHFNWLKKRNVGHHEVQHITDLPDLKIMAHLFSQALDVHGR